MNRPASETLQLLLQPQTPGSFWVENILSGVRAGAARFGDGLRFLEGEELMASDTPVLVVGNDLAWLGATVEGLLERRIHPIVINACMIPGCQNRCSSVVFALEEAVPALRQHFLSLGRRRTVMLGLSPHSAADRIKCEAFGAGPDVCWAEGPVEDCVSAFVRERVGDYDSAICANDTAAICLYRALCEAGLRVPEDFAISGMGNSWLGASLAVPLTTIDFDYAKLGAQAVLLFHSILQNPEPCHESRALPCRLIVRASSAGAAPPASAPVGSVATRDPGSLEGTLYYSGSEVQQILTLEGLLQSCESRDREILFALMRGESCEQIAQAMFFTPRAIRYRVRRLTARFGLSSRAELVALLRRAANLT